MLNIVYSPERGLIEIANRYTYEMAQSHFRICPVKNNIICSKARFKLIDSDSLYVKPKRYCRFKHKCNMLKQYNLLIGGLI